jgi:hypothetical protein
LLSHNGWSGDSATGHRGLPAKEKNDPFNGIALVARIGGEGIHANHPNYDKYMLRLLAQKYSPSMSAEDALDAINDSIIPDLLSHINIAKSQNKSLSEYFLTLL